MRKIKFLFLLLVSGAFILTAGNITAAQDTAENLPRVNVIPDMAFSQLYGRADIIDSADTPAAASLWKPAANTDAVTSITAFSDYPFDPFEGSRCYNITGSQVDASLWRYIDRVYKTPLDLTDYNTFFYAINCRNLSEGETVTSLTFYSSKGSVFSVNAPITAECWNGVFTDISDFSGRSEITRIRIGIRHSYTGNVIYQYNFQVDCIAASRDPALVRTVRFMSGNYMIYGGESSLTWSYDPPKMSIGINTTLASKCFIESGKLTPEITGDDINAVQIRLVNNSACTAVIMEYATSGSPVYTDNTPVRVNITPGNVLMAYYFPLSADNVTQIKFTFEGTSDGFIDIYSITPVAHYSPLTQNNDVSDSKGSISSCRLSDDGRKIIITGTLTEAAVNAHRGSRIELYELEPWQKNEYIFDAGSKPLLSAGITKEFTFETDLKDKDRSRICSRFAAVIYNKDKKQTILLDAPRYITNPEVLSKTTRQYPFLSAKGFIGPPSVLADAGVSQTAVKVDIGKLPAPPGKGIAYTFENNEYYFDPEYTASLDAELDDLRAAYVSSVLVLSLTGNTDNIYASPLMHRDAVMRTLNDSFAFNADTAEGVRYLRAIISFLAERYMKDREPADENNNDYMVIGVTVGIDICTAYLNYNMGKKTLPEFSDSYCRAFRIIYNTVHSVNSKIRIYIPVGSSWDKCLSTGAALSYCGRDLVDIIGEQLRREGNIAWNLALNPVPFHSADRTDKAVIGDVSTDALAALCEYLRRDRLLYENSSRNILLLTGRPEFINEKISPEQYIAEYIAAFFSVSVYDAITGYIVCDSEVYKSSQYDFYKILKYIDTDRAGVYTDFAKSILGIEDWSEIIAGYRSGANIGRRLYESKLTDNLPDMVTGKIALCGFNSEDSTDGWHGSSGLVSLTAANSFKGYKDMLFASFGSLAQDPLCAIIKRFDYARDLSFAPFLTFNIYTDNLPESARTLILTVTVYSAGGYMESKGEIRGGVWHTAVCDLSDFAASNSITGITLRIESPGGTDLSGFRMVVGEISVLSQRYSTEFLEKKFTEEREKYMSSDRIALNIFFVKALTVILVAAISAEIIYTVSRIRRIIINKKENENSDFFKF